MDASDHGFIDANNWLFTSRGIPVLYYGSEIGFMRGRSEHSGNRNPFGPDNIADAKTHRIAQSLAKVAKQRRRLPSLQRGLQVNLDFAGHIATFFRVYQKGDTAQTALVLLNKGDRTEKITVNRLLSTGTWVDADTGVTTMVSDSTASISKNVPAHDVKIMVFSDKINHPDLLRLLDDQMKVLAPSHQLRATISSTATSMKIASHPSVGIYHYEVWGLSRSVVPNGTGRLPEQSRPLAADEPGPFLAAADPAGFAQRRELDGP
jgi:cyclomaltodextrin glucanotransferase